MKSQASSRFARSSIAFSAALLLCALGSCARSCGSGDAGPSGETRFASAKDAKAALQFDYTLTTSLLFSAHDPGSGDLWTTRMVRSGDAWRIALAPEGRTLGDTLANGNWILHVLDTVRTAQLQEVPVAGSMESFGLSNPRVMLKWEVGDQVYELHLGAAESSSGVYGLIAESPGASPSLKQTVYTVEGALIQMLQMISSFDSLRLQTLVTFASDDVDGLEVSSSGKKILTTQRKPDDWKAAPFLDQLCHLRITHFMDDSDAIVRIQALLKDRPLYVLDLNGRGKLSEEIRFAGDASGRIYASITSRKAQAGLSVFEIPPEILGALAILLR